MSSWMVLVRQRRAMLFAFAALVLAALVAAGCGGDDDQAGSDSSGGSPAKVAEAPDTLNVALGTELPPYDPHLYANRFLNVVGDNIWETLLVFDADRQLTPLLAEDLPERVDELTWRFKLREGVTFSDGEPLTTQSVADSINRISDPKLNSEWSSTVGETIDKAVAVDDTTVDVKTKDPDELLPRRTAFIKITPSSIGTDTKAFMANPIGSGPYKWVSGSETGPVELTRNDDYWGEAPPIENINIRVVPDVSTRIASLKAGEIQLLPELPPDTADGVPQLFQGPGLENPVIILGSTNGGITADVNVRKALNLAVDKDALVDLYSGYAEVSKCQTVSPGSFGYNDELQPYPYDPEQAKQLIQDAGANGKTIKFVGARFFGQSADLAQTVSAYWTEAGLKVDLEMPEFDQYSPQYTSKGKDRPDALYVPPSDDLNDASATSKSLATDGVGSGYSNPQVDKLFKESVEASDPAEREAMLKEAQKIACDDAANVFLIRPLNLWGASANLEWEPRFDAALYFPSMSFSE